MTKLTKHIVSLSETMEAHTGLTHWSISSRVTSKGDFISRLKRGGDCSTGTYEAVLERFDKIWPADLEWPAGIPRPEQKEEAA